MASIKLSIAEPCHENWNAMLPEDKGRFCLSCQKTVVDFTAMNDRQVFDYFKNYQGNTCGQFSTDQLNRELTKPNTSSIGRWKYFWQILLPAVFAFQKLEAQPNLRGKVAATPVCKPIKENPERIRMGAVASMPVKTPVYSINGSIINAKKDPVPFASISCSNGKYAVADSLGHFKILLADKASLTISGVGYTTQNFTIDSLQTNNITGLKIEKDGIVIETAIILNHAETKLDEVVVVGYGHTVDRFITGGTVSTITRRTIFSRQKTILPDNTLPQLKIFPNPIQPGQNFQIGLQVKKTGTYLLKAVDAAGRIIMEKQLMIAGKTQTETIDGSALLQPGIYFITLINPADKKGTELNGRIVVQ